jgi:NAD(P)-dependent dehydrogenase (short-subunit alcohol dehydrogenase family)
MGLLDGKVAIVTGAGRGIGRGEALCLASEGAKVVVNDLGGEWDGTGSDERPAASVVEEIQAAGGVAIPNYESVCDFEGARRIVDSAIGEFGRLDLLVNNAGFVRDRMLFKMSEEEFDAVVAVHLKGTFCMGRWAAAYFRDAKHGGSIVNTTSQAGLTGNVGQTNYSAAKGGIAVMTLTWSYELRKYDVICNAIAPTARTRMTERTFGAMEVPEGEFDEAAPENIAPLVVYLGSDEARARDISGYVFNVRAGEVELFNGWRTGRGIDKDGRWTAAELVERMPELFT